MSGDVQPRKRKDKKRKKDDLGVEEPRGTAAVFGEGDVFMHSQHEHGTGGHWCAKIIFFSLLAVLITLIGLIILENRGLSELEANAVESRYSGVLEGWLEDVPEDDHHDEHTLELNHHEDDAITHDEDTQNSEEDEELEHGDEADEDDDNQLDDEENDDQESDEDENELDADDDNLADEDDDNNLTDEDDDDDDLGDEDDDDGNLGDEDDDDGNLGDEDDDRQGNVENEESREQGLLNNEDEEDSEEYIFGKQMQSEEDQQNNDINSEEDNDEFKKDDDLDYSNENNKNENNDESFNDNDDDDQEREQEDDDEQDEQENDDEDVELEKLEKEASEEQPNEEPISTELPALPEDEDNYNNDKDEDASTEADQKGDEFDGTEDEDFLEAEDIVESPVVEHITAPPGKPLIEVEEDVSSEQPPDTLAEEEEYEKRQEELRREEEQSSHMWLKLSVGGALLVATHAVMRRATRDSSDDDVPASRSETPLSDRRMTLIPDELEEPAPVPVRKVLEDIPQPKIEKSVEAVYPIKPTIIKEQDSEEEEEKESDEEEIQEHLTVNKELYSDEDEEEVIMETPKILPKLSAPVVESKTAQDSEPEEEDPDDVEIIDDEQLEELEEEDEEEISDVDDAELLTRLEAKYGKLPEPERPGQKYKDGGNSIDDDWPGEPSDAYWRSQLDSAERELRQGEWNVAAERAGADALRDSARARWIVASALDKSAEAHRDNRLLSRAITAYLHLLKMNERLSDKKLLQITERTLDRIQFRGSYLNAEPVYRLLIRRFPNDPAYRNNLTISFLMGNRADLAEDILKETLKLWPNDRVALAHYGFVLKTSHNRHEDAVKAFEKALEGDTGPANEARFYYHYGDSLLLLGRLDEAHEVHKRGTKLGHFLSPAQRSLYNVPRLKSNPWWKIEDTPYIRLARALEKFWKEILKEGEAAKALYEKDKEGLKERGEWSQLDLFVRGREIPDRCKKAPVTCSIVKNEPAAVGCRRGQIKFSSMAAGTHVRPHVGPTNCRLRMHLGLSNTKDTFIRVDKEIRQWQTGKTLMFDDSFEHEVWHNGTGTRLVLIVDVWHPQLTVNERRQLPSI